MRRWWAAARDSATAVADHADSWLPGALAWSLTVGWIPLVIAVARPPSVADLTFLGARIYTDGSWPWNAVTAGVGAFLLLAVGFVLVTLAEAALLERRRRGGISADALGRLLTIGVVAAAPVVAALLATGIAAVVVAMREFNVPTPGDPMLRTIGRLTPFLAAVVLAWILAGALHAAASRAALMGGQGLVGALLSVPRRLARPGAAVAIHVLSYAIVRVGYLGLSLVLLGVLWDPIGIRLAGRPFDVAALPLLVGFVAIWLCLVLGGGALHAWGSMTWTRVLAGLAARPGTAEHAQGDAHRSWN
jgi:hypothetical protein